MIRNRDRVRQPGKLKGKFKGFWSPVLLTAVLGSAQLYLRHLFRGNSLLGARKNIAEHYDLVGWGWVINRKQELLISWDFCFALIAMKIKKKKVTFVSLALHLFFFHLKFLVFCCFPFSLFVFMFIISRRCFVALFSSSKLNCLTRLCCLCLTYLFSLPQSPQIFPTSS